MSETAIIAGMFVPWLNDVPVYLVTRSKVKGQLIGRPSGGKTVDSQIMSYLVERFASSTVNNGKGTKDDPGWFYGFKGDIWAAYALGVAFIDMKTSGDKKKLQYLEEGKIQ